MSPLQGVFSVSPHPFITVMKLFNLGIAQLFSLSLLDGSIHPKDFF